EINFAESAREMLLTHNYHMVQINFQPFYEKPPLFIWLQVLSMHYFGVTEFAARLPNAICGIVTLITVFNVGRYVFKSQLGVLWALMFACSILPQVYFKSGIIDPVFNLFIFLGIFSMYKVTLHNDFENPRTRKITRRWNLILSAIFIGLATLTKGPVAILIVVLTASVYFFANRGKLKIEIGQMIIWWLVVSLIVIGWLSVESRQSGLTFVSEFIKYQVRLFSTEDAGHGGPFYFHWVILLIGVFPASALIFDAFKKNDNDEPDQVFFKRWMIYLLFVVLILFTIVKTKIIHYSSLCYFPITFLAAYYLNYLLDGKMRWTWKQTVPLFSICLLFVAALTGGIFVIMHPDLISYYVKDEFARECLKTRVYWSNNDIRFGIGYLVLIIFAMGLIQFKNLRWGVYVIVISTALFINTIMTFIIPRVEQYSQAAMIEFLESKKNEDCIIESAGFKSYAQYFYPARREPTPEDSLKPHYRVTKVNKVDELKYYLPKAKELYRKNGFVFFKE
ncbi:MAG: glycosyl transferase family 39, partial [Bacteroidota bacterium]|nr:glycosyl transferase family 39 [Bacteroidota bacterium]